MRRCLRAACAGVMGIAWVAGFLMAAPVALSAEEGSGSEKRAAGDGWDLVAGPLIQHFPLTLEPGQGMEAMGPFYYEREMEDGRLWAVPPLISSFRSEDGEKAQLFVLPPIFSYRKYGEDWRWQLGQWINRSHVESIEDQGLKRFNLFPFFFYQDAPDPKRDYWAVFPVYGNLKNRMFRDESEFVLFPLWLKSRKGTMTTRNVLFPFIHFRDGPGLDGWQFWPLAGHEHQEARTRTNVLDEVEVIGGYDKTFALWPVWFRNRTGIGTDNAGRVDAVLPMYYRERSPERDHTSVLWPLFSKTDDRKEGFTQWNLPWPLVGFAHGEGKTLKRVLPFFSVGHNKTLTSETYLWPIYRRRQLRTESFERDRKQVAIFLYSDQKDSNVGTGKTSRRVEAWPFFHWTRDPEGNERLQALTVIEPFGRGTGMSRNWVPLWSFWRQEMNPTTGRSSRSLLWNLFRQETGPEETKGSLLFGLVQYHTSSNRTRWRWFHLGPRLESSQHEPRVESESDVSTHR